MKRAPDARLPSKIPHLEFDILVLFKGSLSSTRNAESTLKHLNGLYIETNCYVIAVSVDGIHD